MSKEDKEGGDDTYSQVGDRATLPSSPSYATAPSSPPTVRHARGNNFQRWRRQMQKARRWGPTNNDDSRDDYSSSNFIRSSKNLELLANQKRQWYQIQSKAKLHRLGRVSFRAVKSKRDYLMHRNSYNWLYLSRLAALKEYAFMKIDDNEKVTMIDFPQMVSVSHRNAKMYFDRDVECIFKFFRKRYNLILEVDETDECEGSGSENEGNVRPSSSVAKYTGSLDKELAVSGFTRKDQDVIDKFIEGVEEQHDSASSNEERLTNDGVNLDEVTATKLELLGLEDQNVNGASKEFQPISLLDSSDNSKTVCTEEHKTNNFNNDDDSSKPGMDNEIDTPIGEEVLI